MSNIDVRFSECDITEINNKLITFYTFEFSFGKELCDFRRRITGFHNFLETHTFRFRYSELFKLNQSLLTDPTYKQLFNNKLPVFPSKNWMKNYTKPKNYNARAQQLLTYFKTLISNPSILTIAKFVNGIKLHKNPLVMRWLKTWTWKCDKCKYSHKLNEQICQHCKAKTILIPLKIQEIHNKLCDVRIPLHISYSLSTTIRDVFDNAIIIINDSCYPTLHYIYLIMYFSFIKEAVYSGGSAWDKICSKSITEYNINDIVEKGLRMRLRIKYTHKIYLNDTTCKYIAGVDEKDDNDKVLSCPIYGAMKLNYEFSEENLQHLYEYTHFKDEYNDKPKCRYGQQCKAFVRLQIGGNRLDDRCHIKIYRHPPRNNKQIKLPAGINSFVINDYDVPGFIQIDHPVFGYCYDTNLFDDDPMVTVLIDEVVTNGYKYDLCLDCTSSDDCKHSEFSLLTVVDEKLNHFRHKQIGNPLNKAEMLSIILYTGGDCNYNLCKNQRNGNYQKWKWFDYFLYHAITKLSERENGSYQLYTGLDGVKLNSKLLCGFSSTYISTSWIKDIASSFIGVDGMIIEIDKKIRSDGIIKCCDVSWISKFPDECEVLMARGGFTEYNLISGRNEIALTILDENNGVQTTRLTYFGDEDSSE